MERGNDGKSNFGMVFAFKDGRPYWGISDTKRQIL
jgi:hypothetical protein